ncbi:MAG: CsgG/HfaB family protein [Campylobacterota bacterium]|nr:CsgG/HfaB family protein [Campylobacterota bacterium]
MKLLKLTILLSITIYFTACSQKTTIKAIKPSQISDKDTKEVAIKDFKNDTVSLSSNIKSNMDKIYFNDEKYFKIVNRDNLDSILKEQKLQDSGLVYISSDKTFDIAEVKSLITGKVNSKNYTKNHFTEQRTNYDKCIKYKTTKSGKKYCDKYQKYNVNCTNHSFSIDAFISINRVSNADIIYSENFTKQSVIKNCEDKNSRVPNKQNIYSDISKSIADDFVSKITPSYQYFRVTLIENEDIDYTDEEEKLLENSLKLIELNHMEKANQLLKELVVSTKSQSSTALYNFGVTNEALGYLDTAYSLYKKAEKISMKNEINEDIIFAVKRIKNSLTNRKKAMKQIKE